MRGLRLFAATTVLIIAIPAGAEKRPTPSPDGRLAKLTAGAAPGKPVDCIHQTIGRDGQRIGGMLVYRVGRTYYVNRFGDGGCNFTDFDIVVTSTPGTQLCRGDTARVIDSTTRLNKGACIFGAFTPYERAK